MRRHWWRPATVGLVGHSRLHRPCPAQLFLSVVSREAFPLWASGPWDFPNLRHWGLGGLARVSIFVCRTSGHGRKLDGRPRASSEISLAIDER